MQDNLKDHIDLNRDQFDTFPFDSEKGWEGISAKFEVKKRKGVKPGWSFGIASGIILIILAVLVVGFSLTTGSIKHEVVELESYYTREINHKISLVKRHTGEEKILEDLTAMDVAFAELKADLDENVDNEEVILAMMENYQLKLRVLEEILKELEQGESETEL